MKKYNLDMVCEYLHSLENSSAINKEIISLSHKIEHFCFQCVEDDKDECNTLENNAFFIVEEGDLSFEEIKDKSMDCNIVEDNYDFAKEKDTTHNNIDYNPSLYIDHDILNKYLYLCDYLENSYDKIKSLRYLNDLIIKTQISNDKICNLSYIDSNLLSNIFNGKSDITKDTAIKLCIGLRLDYNESIDLLLRCGYTLSSLNKRDCIIKYGIDNNFSLEYVNYLLYELNEKELIRK